MKYDTILKCQDKKCIQSDNFILGYCNFSQFQEFVLNEKFLQNTSKFVIFFISCFTLFFFLKMNASVKKDKGVQNENR